ncbi:Alcohol dehydrogenase superfamily, zinc-containing [Cordyceps fumosorosea ARSEF 2679]|uniref:Alcohol dehydrogenase superfamily, zinc-containing n=1 Tax=Cordyceps fumosorosea (strain ARSEF 2679) TaxID=1081104 RepID=A0A162MUH4_CORFA|nr:Alcohol dehydrogenase superfamily, zinc-containing [Cordyceps fumosorosea ARSEF 2679]OAA70649.1 Alcohol dehydrogenase superfamily, zinc-containing [Cordyceps fumosorosea ARSEF 2679]
MPRALTLDAGEGGRPGKVYYPLQVKQVPRPKPGSNEVLVRIKAAALNHRDLWARRHLYPGLSLENPLLADGAGVVVELGPDVKRTSLLNQAVILTPMRGWEADPVAPEDPHRFAVIGASLLCDAGTGQDYLAVPEDEVEPAPAHLTPAECAALPLCGLTGWRALVSKAGVTGPGKNVLVTGVGGGVALQVLQFAVALGSAVYVTSGDRGKIDRAVAMGARGGVSYREAGWAAGLLEMLPEDRPWVDAVVDGAGGNLIAEVAPIMRPGGVIAQYGMTAGNKMDWQMRAVLANLELKGSTMGSRREFRDMVAFVAKHKIKPVVSRAVKGLSDLEAIESLFVDMQHGRQFGKLVIEIDEEDQAKL